MALPANTQEGSGTAEGIYLESEKDSATVCTWQAKLRGSTNKFVGYVGSVEEAMTVIRQYELETTTKFSCFKSDKMFGAGDPFAKQRKVYFKDDKIPFDGVPFSIIGTKVFDCQHGPDRKKSFKARHSEEKIRDDTERLRRDMSKKLKTDITSGQKPQVERRIYIQLTKGDEHKDHITGEVC